MKIIACGYGKDFSALLLECQRAKQVRSIHLNLFVQYLAQIRIDKTLKSCTNNP